MEGRSQSQKFLELVEREHRRIAVCARDSLIHVAMHDLRSPLNGIQGWLQVLESRLDGVAPVVRRALDGVHNCVQQQTQILNDTSEMLKIMEGTVVPDPTSVDLRSVLDNAMEAAESSAEARQISFVVQGQTGVTVWGDPEYLAQSIRYVLSYAVRCASSGDRYVIQILATDNDTAGVRIAREHDVQADANWQHTLPHAPMVWQLAQCMIELHGGTLRAALDPDFGVPNKFEICLPAKPADQQRNAPTRQQLVAGRAQLYGLESATVGILGALASLAEARHLAALGARVEMLASVQDLRDRIAAGEEFDVLLVGGTAGQAYPGISCLSYGGVADAPLAPGILARIPDDCEPLYLAAMVAVAVVLSKSS